MSIGSSAKAKRLPADNLPVDTWAHPLVVFDGVCVLCEKSVRFISANDRRGRFHFAAAQSPLAQEIQKLLGVDVLVEETVMLIRNGEVYQRSDAITEILRELDTPVRAMGLLRHLPRPLRDAGYRLVARNRYNWFGRYRECKVPDEKLRRRVLQ